ncbi:MAG: ABC transporter permease, partial [Defluviitaleaceae bacterium]|nr:ABC transporter permease [Defluviitaleaceae bacterium]
MKIFHDSWIMFKRCMLISTRNPETIVMAIVTPFFLMALFGTLFGNIADIGDYNYIDFIIPGIILQAVAQASQYTAINITNDMTKGMIDRFRSMPVSKASVLIGHAASSVVRNIVTTAVIIATAFLIGFRPSAGFFDWLP